jgi:hypothetical protein
MVAQDNAVVQHVLQGWYVLYPSLLWTAAIVLPLGAATCWLKRNVVFTWTDAWISRAASQFTPSVPNQPAAAAISDTASNVVAAAVRWSAPDTHPAASMDPPTGTGMAPAHLKAA